MRLAGIDIVVVVIYFGVIAALGLFCSRRNKNTEAYFLGGRSFGGLVVGLSLVGTSISSVTFLAFPADAYKTAWLRYIPCLALPIGALIAAYVFLPFFRRARITSAYEYLEDRFGPSIRVYGATAFIIGQLVRISLILYLLSLLAHEILGIHPLWCVVIAGVFVAFYTVVGGIEAVIWTDVLQTIVLAIGGVLCLGVIVSQLPGGLSQIFEVAIAEEKLSFVEWDDGRPQPIGLGFSLQHKTVLMVFLMGLVTWLTEYSANQNTVQRYCVSRSTREARKAMLVCVCASLPIWGFYMFLGTALYVFFQQFPSPAAAEMLTGARKAEQILPFFIVHYLPTGLTGLLIAAAVAAAMSSLDSSINAIATVGVTDLYRRHLVKGRSDRHYLKAAYSLATLASVFMIGGAGLLTVVESKTLQDTGTILASLLAAGLLSIYLLGFLTRKGDARAVGLGILATLTFTTWTVVAAYAPNWLPSAFAVPFDLYYTGMIGNVVMFAVGYAVGCLLPSQPRNLANLTIWDQSCPNDPSLVSSADPELQAQP